MPNAVEPKEKRQKVSAGTHDAVKAMSSAPKNEKKEQVAKLGVAKSVKLGVAKSVLSVV